MGEAADVAVEDSGSVDVRKSEQRRKKVPFKENEYLSDLDEEVKTKGKRCRKKKIIADSDENNVAAEEGENVKKEEKKKPGRKKKEIFSSGDEFETEQKGGRCEKSGEEETPAVEDGENGGFVKEEKNKSGGKIKIEDELVGEKKSESDVLKEEDQDHWEIGTNLSLGYSLRRTAAVKKPKYIEPKQMKRWDKIINTDEEVRLSKYLLKGLFPYLRQLDGEQMIEKEREAKRLSILL
ncbi:hypothetical protein TSUD_01780 [Trifolium subterraneum]|nr:hypothetical protein TSUD_01780 [Trifolium subterraneum]